MGKRIPVLIYSQQPNPTSVPIIIWTELQHILLQYAIRPTQLFSDRYILFWHQISYIHKPAFIHVKYSVRALSPTEDLPEDCYNYPCIQSIYTVANKLVSQYPETGEITTEYWSKLTTEE